MSKDDILVQETQSVDLSNILPSSLELITGSDVLKIVESSKIMEGWAQLYAKCPWSTIFQSPDFVKCWYQCFADKYQPILVLSYSGDALTGVLPLAGGIKGLGVAGAGGWDAYYHTWLALPENANSFIAAALDLVRSRFPNQDIFFKYLPAQAPTQWLQNDKRWSRCSVSRLFDVPILNLKDPGVAKLLNKKQFKAGYNKFKRMGEVAFTAVTDLNEFKAALELFADQHDFRKGYMFRTMPFRENPSFKKFMCGLFAKGLLDVTVFTLNKELVACSVTTLGKNNGMHAAGVNTYSPVYGRLGPSFMILNLAALRLKAEGYDYFDLTPGGHTYKERHANTRHRVSELRITSRSKAYYLNNFFVLKEYLKTQLSKRNIDPRELHRRFKTYLLNGTTIANRMLANIKVYRRSVSNAEKAKVSVWTYTPLQISERLPLPVMKNKLSHILEYTPNGSGICKWDFFRAAKNNFDEGSVAYSYSENGVLLFLIWHAVNNKINSNLINTNDAGPVLKDLYCQPKAQHKLHMFLVGVYEELSKQHNHTCMHLSGMDFSVKLKEGLKLQEKI